MYICVYVCIHIYVHIYTLIYSACSVHVDSEICAHTSYIYIYICIYACVYVYTHMMHTSARGEARLAEHQAVKG